jgi:hypothetical protein
MQMNVQLHHVVTDMTGETWMRIIHAVVAGERDPAVLATHRVIGAAMPISIRKSHSTTLAW